MLGRERERWKMNHLFGQIVRFERKNACFIQKSKREKKKKEIIGKKGKDNEGKDNFFV